MTTERPIIMQPESVRGILADRKTQTRRLAKFDTQPGLNLSFTGLEATRFGESWALVSRGIGAQWEERSKTLRSPYGLEGGRLWVRETFCPFFRRTERNSGCVFKADDNGFGLNPGWSPNGKGGGWKNSIFMPRWASRITLEVTEVRVERLQHISEADAIAEGIEPISTDHRDGWRNYGAPEACRSARNSYATLWESINGVRSWDANPFVFAISFRRITT